MFLIWATECCRLNSCLAKFYGLARPNLIIVASDRLRFRFHILFVLPFLHVCITFAPQLSPHPSTLIRYSQSLGRMKSRDAFFFGPLARMPLSFPSKKVRTMCIFARFGFLIEFSVDCKNRREVPPSPLPLLPLLVFDDLRWPLLRQLAASVDGQKQIDGEGGGLFVVGPRNAGWRDFLPVVE